MSRQSRHTVRSDQPDREEIMRLATPGPSPERTQHLLDLRRSSGPHRSRSERGSRSNRRQAAVRESVGRSR